MTDLHKIPDDVKQEALGMLRDGLTVMNVARYMGISKTAILYWTRQKFRKGMLQAQKKWCANNKEKRAKIMRSYYLRNKERLQQYKREYMKR